MPAKMNLVRPASLCPCRPYLFRMSRARLIVMNAALGPLDYRVPQGMRVGR